MNKEDKFYINELSQIRAFCINSDKEDIYMYIHSLQQQNKKYKEVIDKVSYKIESYTTLNPIRIRQELLDILKEVE